ncbi:MAG: glycolate oxidase subunit GlcE, partial [Acidiferrobacterales bacterium]
MIAASTKDISNKLADRVKQACDNGTVLNIRGSATKSFLANSDHDKNTAELITTTEHQGIVNYEPRELVVTARSGTRLADIEKVLAGENQMLAFEPPAFGEQATLGGTIACALSGPRRPYTGSARDYVLGVQMINGRGEAMVFGGQVMKNVAGYDVSRLMTGTMGTLGILLDISLKVLPAPETEMTLTQELSPADARKIMIELSRQYLPISAMSYTGRFLNIRLSGTQSAVTASAEKIGGDTIQEHETFWHDIREQQ